MYYLVQHITWKIERVAGVMTTVILPKHERKIAPKPSSIVKDSYGRRYFVDLNGTLRRLG